MPFDIAANQTHFDPAEFQSQSIGSEDDIGNNDQTPKPNAMTPARNNTFIRPAILDVLSTVETNAQNNEATSSKRARLDNDVLPKNWYDSLQQSVAKAMNDFMLQVKERHEYSSAHISLLEQQLGELKEKIQLMEQQEKKSQIQIKHLEEENDTLRKNSKSCRNCGQAVNFMLFCGIGCQNAIE